MYHGHGLKPPFFEGWYYKLVNQAEDQRYAIIPGIILGERGHAFIQVLDGIQGTSTYHVFPSEQFWAAEDRFEVHIGANTFTPDRIAVQIDDEQARLSGELRFDGLSPWPVRWHSPGIMGWYAWVPRMECYHGVLSLDHAIAGSLQVNDQSIDFSAGRGYIEKDWGQAFPQAWIWGQTNHFEQPGTSLTISVATIPWLGRSFREGTRYRVIAAEPEAAPSLTRGVYAYDYGDTGKMAPLVKMHTLWPDFVPAPIHAGGRRYHGMSPLVSHLKEIGAIEARSVHQRACFPPLVLGGPVSVSRRQPRCLSRRGAGPI